MADTPKRLSGPAPLTTSAATLYTAPASTITTIRYMLFTNVTGSDATITVHIGTAATGNKIIPGMTVPAGGIWEWFGTIPLAAAEFVQALAGTGSAINATIVGVETT